MSGADTGLSATLASTRPTAVDQACADVATRFLTDAQFRNHMTPEQVAAVANF
jgi:hypothetical protein